MTDPAPARRVGHQPTLLQLRGWVHYHQVYLLEAGSDLSGMLDDGLASPVGIICVRPGSAFLTTGLHTGVVGFTVAGSGSADIVSGPVPGRHRRGSRPVLGTRGRGSRPVQGSRGRGSRPVSRRHSRGSRTPCPHHAQHRNGGYQADSAHHRRAHNQLSAAAHGSSIRTTLRQAALPPTAQPSHDCGRIGDRAGSPTLSVSAASGCKRSTHREC